MRYRRALPPWQRLGQCGGAASRGGRRARVPEKRKSLWHSAAGLLSGEDALFRGGRTPPPRCARPAGRAPPTGRQGAARRKEGIGRGQSSTHQTLQRGAAPGPLCFPGVTGGRRRRTHDSCDQPRHLHNRKDKEKLHATVRQSFRVCTTRRARDAPAHSEPRNHTKRGHQVKEKILSSHGPVPPLRQQSSQRGGSQLVDDQGAAQPTAPRSAAWPITERITCGTPQTAPPRPPPMR